MSTQWFVLHTLSGQELKVKESIEKRIKTEEMGDLIREVLVPMEKVAEVRNGKKTVTSRKLYPGYVFIDMVPGESDRAALVFHPGHAGDYRLCGWRSADADAGGGDRLDQGSDCGFGGHGAAEGEF